MATDAYASKYNQQLASGRSRGSTTSSGVFSLDMTNILEHEVLFALAYDDAIRLASVDDPTEGNMSTFITYIPLAPIGLTARWRAVQHQTSAGGTNSSYASGTSTTGLFVRWVAFGR